METLTAIALSKSQHADSSRRALEGAGGAIHAVNDFQEDGEVDFVRKDTRGAVEGVIEIKWSDRFFGAPSELKALATQATRARGSQGHGDHAHAMRLDDARRARDLVRSHERPRRYLGLAHVGAG
jgi:hypothetical protein